MARTLSALVSTVSARIFNTCGEVKQMDWNCGRLLTVFLVLTILFFPVSTLAKVEGDCYYDNNTGHKYVKTGNYYTEYTKVGELFNVVDPDLPLLNDPNRITLISEGHYIQYRKCTNGRKEYKVIPATGGHPKGWKADCLVGAD